MRSFLSYGSARGKTLTALWAAVLLFCPALSGPASAEDTRDTITAESLEYDAKTQKYTAAGSVEIRTEDAVIRADEVIYFRERSEIEASGNVQIEDGESLIRAGEASFNTEANTGRLVDADISYGRVIPGVDRKDRPRKIFYHIAGKEIEKRAEREYYSSDASLTTCETPVPAWCFRARNIHLLMDDSVRARDMSFRVKNVPVLYSPYLWAPLLTERKSGFLMPVVGYSKSRGLNLNIPYFWAIAENRDATFLLDIFGKRGIGSGVEYRFVKPGDISSNWWMYHIRDSETRRNYWEAKIAHENRFPHRIGGFLNLNYVNEKDFYREFSTRIQTRAQRFLESTGEVHMPLKNSRLYLLAQYWVDLRHESGNVPHRLPEIGYVLHEMHAGPLLISGSVSASNIWRENGLSGRRFDLYPGISHSFGRDFTVSQKAKIRTTLYSFYKEKEGERSDERSAFEYDLQGHSRFFRKYAAFTHVAEPGIRYHFITSSQNSLAVFDATELYRKTSRIELTLMNRFLQEGKELMVLRLAQGLETYQGDRPFLPLTLEVAMKSPFPLKLDASYDVHSGILRTVSADLGFHFPRGAVTFGQRYNKAEDVFQYRTGVVMDIDKSMQLAGTVWYDAKAGELTDMNVSLRYLSQCWGIKIELEKKPKDYSLSVMYELTGLISNIPRK